MKTQRRRFAICAMLIGLLFVLPLGGIASETGVAAFQIAGRLVYLPDGWDAVEGPTGAPQIQFLESNGKQGSCIVRVALLSPEQTAADSKVVLEEVCASLGGDIYTLIRIGNRDVATFDCLQDGGRNITHGVFVEDSDAVVVQLYITESRTTLRQQALLVDIIKGIGAKE